ncbi:hypothetical protein HpHA286_02110 [Helicobacter pylori]
MVEVRFFGPIKEENFFIKANDLKELRAILQEKEGLKEWLGVCAIALNDHLIRQFKHAFKRWRCNKFVATGLWGLGVKNHSRGIRY